MVKIFGGERVIPRCEGCGKAWITEIQCESGMTIRGKFEPSPLEFLTEEEHDFLILFLRARGNLKELERYTGQGYFSLRGKLERILQKLGLEPLGKEEEDEDIFELVRKGKMTIDEALKKLKGGEGE